MSVNIQDIIDPETGVQSSAVYTDREIFELELKNVFAKSWLLLGHDSQIPQPGDFITTRMATDDVIVTRHRDGTIHAMLNQCRHRGVKLCRGDHGNTRSFTCSYHGWCFDTSGKLLTMPHEERVYKGHLEKEKWGLIKVPRVETYNGLIFGSWDEEIEPLEDYLAEAKWYLDAYFDRTPGGAEILSVNKWRLQGNWKWGVEQHVSDFYHAQVSHISFVLASVAEASINRLMPEGQGNEERGLQFSSPSRGHGGGWMCAPDEATLGEAVRAHRPEVVKYLREVGFPSWSERLGGKSRSEEMTVCHMSIFPNMSCNKAQNYIRIWNPISPDETEVWSFLFVDKEMPDDIKKAYMIEKANTFTAAGGLEQDDTENTVLAQRGVTGFMAAKTKLNMQMGHEIDPAIELKGQPGHDFDGPGQLSTEYSELALRNFYRRYAELLTAE